MMEKTCIPLKGPLFLPSSPITRHAIQPGLILDASIARDFEGGEYRPNVKIFLRDLHGRILFVQSVKAVADDNWTLLSGGINKKVPAQHEPHPYEPIHLAIYREIEEEVGIKPDQIVIPPDFFLDDYYALGRPKEGFTQGKHHYCVQAIFTGDPNQPLKLQEDEIAKAKWVTPAELQAAINTINASTRETIRAVINQLSGANLVLD